MNWGVAVFFATLAYLGGLWQGLWEGQTALAELTEHCRSSLVKVQDQNEARYKALLEVCSPRPSP